jgi:hypothetical protein
MQLNWKLKGLEAWKANNHLFHGLQHTHFGLILSTFRLAQHCVEHVHILPYPPAAWWPAPLPATSRRTSRPLDVRRGGAVLSSQKNHVSADDVVSRPAMMKADRRPSPNNSCILNRTMQGQHYKEEEKPQDSRRLIKYTNDGLFNKTTDIRSGTQIVTALLLLEPEGEARHNGGLYVTLICQS